MRAHACDKSLFKAGGILKKEKENKRKDGTCPRYEESTIDPRSGP